MIASFFFVTSCVYQVGKLRVSVLEHPLRVDDEFDVLMLILPFMDDS